MENKQTCEWPGNDPLMIRYHDEEWGVPVHDDTKLFEFLVLDAFQAGLSWRTVLNKRENFRKAFDQYDVHKIASYGDAEIQRLLTDDGIIRNKAKISATIENAKRFLDVQHEFGSFDSYIWQFTNSKTIHNRRETLKDLPASTPLSDNMSNDLRKRGFKFVGSTICYAFMQAAGMVNDHLIQCYRHPVLKGK
ncbi:MAG: DNA-3-methyladenine glycosylase I [Bacteroidales bacterium]|nr:DNA-3-methyladenine glycosylase I [Bacteroidales bacterium]